MQLQNCSEESMVRTMVTDSRNEYYTCKTVVTILKIDDCVKLFLGFYKEMTIVIDSTHNNNLCY